MAWTTFPTLTDGTVLTGAHMQLVRDNFAETGPAKVTAAGQILVGTGANAIAARTITSAIVTTQQTTVSTTYADLTTAGPSVTVTTGTAALVWLNAALGNDTAGARSEAAYAVSGATTVAETALNSIFTDAHSISRLIRCGVLVHQSGLTPGSNTFTMRYRVGSNTGIFSTRSITVLPL